MTEAPATPEDIDIDPALATAVARLKLPEQQLMRRAWPATSRSPSIVTGNAIRTAEAMVKRGLLKLHDSAKGKGVTLTPEGHRLAQELRRNDWAGCDEVPASTVTPIRPLEDLAAQLDDAPIAGEPDPRPEDDGGDDGRPFDGAGDPGPADAIPPDPSGHRPAADRPKGEIWKGSPVRPLGHRDGAFYYLDPHGQLRCLTKHDAQSIMGLFGHRLPALYHAFPKFVADRKTGALYRKAEHFDHQLAASAMFKACGERGLFDPVGSIRGPGAWTDEDGRLIYHCGDVLIVDGKEVEPQTIDGKVYTASPAIPHPAPPSKDARTPGDDAQAALETFGTGNGTGPRSIPC
ncbi:hypothetical protein MASR1M32_10430 [Rhodobacter sp.]